MRAILGLALVGVLVLGSGRQAAACGPESDCVLGDRHYRIRMPAGHNGAARVGAILYAHGYKGSAAGAMGNAALGAMADRLGVALVAVKSAGDDWTLPGAPSMGVVPGTDEVAYFDRVRADVLARFPIDAARLMVAGFSAGAMMTWTLACARGGDYAAFLPMAGTFWRPMPERCGGPAATVIHIHGTADRIVPLEGRQVEDARQGSVAEALAMYARIGEFGPVREAVAGAGADAGAGALRCEDRHGAGDRLLRFCLHDGGHSFRAEHVEMGWRVGVEGAGG
ncbi:MAG: polyhydroxybutyrate depolymerase [Pseudomonadota bacterium]